jgi:hypothetical protein
MIALWQVLISLTHSLSLSLHTHTYTQMPSTILILHGGAADATTDILKQDPSSGSGSVHTWLLTVTQKLQSVMVKMRMMLPGLPAPAPICVSALVCIELDDT